MCALQSARPQREYPCGQQDLYTVVETGWASFIQHLSRFENLSTKYSVATATAQLAALQAARALPDEDNREEVHKTLRIEMKGLAETCLIKWSDMSSYIRDGFSEDVYENKRVAAGYNYYASAAHENWDDVKALMQDGLLFLNANTTVLTDDGGMPATFAADFEGAKDAFELKYQAYLQAEEEAKVLTDQKVIANNALYRALMKMFEDGKKIFREEAAIREQFTFDRVLNLVSGSTSTASSNIPATVVELVAFVYNRDTEQAIEGAQLTVFNAPGAVTMSAVSNLEGMLTLRISGFEPNQTIVLDAEIMANEFQTEGGGEEVTAGNSYSLDIGMQPIFDNTQG